MSYSIEYDKSLAPPGGADLVAFMEDFYRTSDTESLHEKYVQNFTNDATLIMGPKEAKGLSGTYCSLQFPLMITSLSPVNSYHRYPPSQTYYDRLHKTIC